MEQHISERPPVVPLDLRNEYLFVRHNGSLIKLTVADIDYVQADGNYCYLQEGERKLASKTSLRRIKSLLAAQGFVQVNRGQLVNFRKVQEVDFARARVTAAGRDFTIGDTYRQEVESWINKL